MALHVSPTSFAFVVGPSSAHSSSTMTLKNKGGSHLAFKVLTTSKDRYRVRPTSGVLAPEQTAAILLILTSRDVPTDITEWKRDKFMVKHLACPPDASDAAVKELWATAATEDVQHLKLPCTHSVDRELPPCSPPVSPGGSPALPPASDDSPQQTGAESTPPLPLPLDRETEETEELEWLREAEQTVAVQKSEEQPAWLTAAESSLGLGSPVQSRSDEVPELSSPDASGSSSGGPSVAEGPPLARLPPSLGPWLATTGPASAIDASGASAPAKLLARGLALLVPEVRDGALWCLSFGAGVVGVVLLHRVDRWLCSWVV